MESVHSHVRQFPPPPQLFGDMQPPQSGVRCIHQNCTHRIHRRTSHRHFSPTPHHSARRRHLARLRAHPQSITMPHESTTSRSPCRAPHKRLARTRTIVATVDSSPSHGEAISDIRLTGIRPPHAHRAARLRR
jgi:hypothetical protein